ncbi:MAG TPA: 5-formyltetrahydrofolate cyclo-ligase [Tenuifilum sp.]|uniref:5-formyltetrahydrofolate cyclo-ligase n=1 Tax=Tenuifilum sp. TaxID=2760880 RepID=UPI001B453216|nr:5-formyltetrahydrofolate cyclo-ligase [Bacteroidales bacterium]HOU74530.1 5-formyltetrahydrofolate cyclo-ligase [Tenuifilum sp.]HQI89409.1 5-formyltetrahydrofolate cyclo-ligase [Tenuifilum sp.]
MSKNELKNQIRKAIKSHRLLLDPFLARERASYVFAEIESMEQFQKATTVLAFWSLPDEINTHDFVIKWAGSKRMVLPVVVGDELELRLFNGVENMEKSGGFGIMEPKTGSIVNADEIDFAIIPGVAFDRNGNRLGRGKGYYDRTLPLLRNAVKVGIAYEFQIIDSVPVSEHDIPVDLVVSN